MTTKECKHKYEARYTEEPLMDKVEYEGAISSKQLRELMIRKVYIHDICVKCGNTVKE